MTEKWKLDLGDGKTLKIEKLGSQQHIVESSEKLGVLCNKIVSRPYQQIEAMKVQKSDGEETVLVIGTLGACQYILKSDEQGFYEEVAGPYHGIEYFKEVGMFHGWYGTVDPVVDEVIDPFVL